MAKTIRKKTIRKNTKSKRKPFPYGKWLSGLFIILFCYTIYHYRDALLYYFSFKTDKVLKQDKATQARIFQILRENPDRVVGFDVSEYQGDIDWEAVDSVEGRKLRFVFIRSTCGNDKLDARFIYNWKKAKENHFIRGAYHYYRPNENSIEQANNFIKYVKLQSGDLPPVVDIEQMPKTQSMDSLKVGLKRFCTKIEKHFGTKPIIYSGQKYYEDFLKEEFSGYVFWVANYNFFVETIQDDWTFWQFTEKAVIRGVSSKVDINIYNGTPLMLNYLKIK